ncbi:MAG: AI-2E family transporter, partial [Tissierellia bacterium]|nr:AI-2E family transporter [Tissierellia bacterium]
MKIKTKQMREAMLLILYAVFIWWVFENIKLVGIGLNLFLGILTPFIIGLVIAFILNKPMSYIEEKLFASKGPLKDVKDKYHRPIGLLITLILFILVVALVLIIVIPNIVGAGEQLAEKLPLYWEDLQEYIKNSSIKYSKINDWIQEIDLNEINDNIVSFVKGRFTDWLGSTVTVFSSVVGG